MGIVRREANGMHRRWKKMATLRDLKNGELVFPVPSPFNSLVCFL